MAMTSRAESRLSIGSARSGVTGSPAKSVGRSRIRLSELGGNADSACSSRRPSGNGGDRTDGGELASVQQVHLLCCSPPLRLVPLLYAASACQQQLSMLLDMHFCLNASTERVKVFVRIRPTRPESETAGALRIKESGTGLVVFRDAAHSSVPCSEFEFDAVMPPSAIQTDVYNAAVKPIVADVLNGYNGTVRMARAGAAEPASSC